MLFEEERKLKIRDYVQTHERASVQELAAAFQVSESTVRRDLKDLEDSKQLKRTHGGAVAVLSDNTEPPFNEKEDRLRKQKEAIARAAAAMVREGDSILLDAGSTTYYLAKELKAFKKLTVVTNSIVAAQELSSQPHIDLLLTGGTLRHETLAMVGPVAEKTLGMVRVDKVFLAINGLDSDAGLTTPSMSEAEMKRLMIRAGKQVILLADHSKYGKVSFARVAGLEEIHQIITDSGIPALAAGELEAAGIQLSIAELQGDEA
ncbi:DeoR/GlpR family DNA-binding transcription regulator [Gorillibacterium sp. sgz5001074]|uniref:DeoR/GlpR family DNA-binding transcription regulator n=1 Tax=Gorillibacterium sp. sgz5001074 TaxID=3446695 RepID=UPI003F67B05E